jgi:uncharacterized membrane protein AbrB (regulator of aidB expression)
MMGGVAAQAAKNHCKKFRQYFSSVMIGILLVVSLINITFELNPNSKHDMTLFWSGLVSTIGGAMMGLAFKKTAGSNNNNSSSSDTTAAGGSTVSLF